MQWLLYSAGALGWSMISFALMSQHMVRYAPPQPNPHGWPLLAASGMVGAAMLVGRIFDAISDPLIGNLSDRTRTRWGRRRPFMAAGIVPMVGAFILVFTPPWQTEGLHNVIYLGVVLVFFMVAFTLYVGPYLALLPEISRTPAERMALSTMLGVALLTGTALGAIGAPGLAAKLGFPGMAVTLGLAGFVAMLAPFAVREQPRPSGPPPVGLIAAIQAVWANPPFRPYIVSQILIMTTLNTVITSAVYFAQVLLGKPTEYGSVIMGVVMGAAALGFVPVNVLARRLGKRRTFQITMIWLGCGLALLGAFPFLGVRAIGPWLGALALMGLPLGAVFILPNALLADIVDADAERSGQRREAIHFGVQALGTKMSYGLSSLMTGLILGLGNSPDHPLGVQLILPFAAVFPLLAAWVFVYYPIEK